MGEIYLVMLGKFRGYRTKNSFTQPLYNIPITLEQFRKPLEWHAAHCAMLGHEFAGYHGDFTRAWHTEYLRQNVSKGEIE